MSVVIREFKILVLEAKLLAINVNNIGKLKDFLLQHRKDYINAYSHAMSEYVRMTDNERDQIDQDAQIFMRTSHKDIHSPQVKQHREAVLDFIGDYLKRVCKLYSEQRAIRVKRVVDKKRLSRLEPDQSNKSKTTSSPEITVQTSSEELEEKSICEISKGLENQEHLSSSRCPLRSEDVFEQENQRLVGEMNSLFDEVRQIEGKVVEISRLQEIFTEKVLQQEVEIDNIHQIVVGATENIKEGNEDIREAIKNNAGFRVWILFFLVMCSFSLLFLDWYGS
ncbi:hypothetical protein JD844_027334 [Phrynosoma platyrhinos]|uniref:Syntaxin-18 n=1 Tax=Phrynosoma platyrhinos TaxID=52577 RepID=A0ABQ7SG58_PHRPL|nr:hypothetical protein JD844_027334 [Phrynosoma platyrhinos]